MTHTPTPWRFTEDGRATTVRADDATCPKPIAEIWDNGDSREDNAAFIVTAVNAYDKQRALIETLVKALEPMKAGYDASVWHSVSGIKMKRILVAKSAIERIDAALAAAKEITQ